MVTISLDRLYLLAADIKNVDYIQDEMRFTEVSSFVYHY